jgi:diguanylate cyclase (GGDEF)-like protein
MKNGARTKKELLDEMAALRKRIAELEARETGRPKSEQEIEQAVCFDILTGLPNRTVFFHHLQQAIALAERNKQPVAVLFFGLDRFKIINDAFGPAVGDLLLKEVAQRLSDSLRKSDILARPGRDEFMILLTEVAKVGDVRRVVERIFAALAVSVTVGNHDLIVTGSLGISLYPIDGSDAETLIRNAYTALSLARQENKNTVHYYSAAMNAGAFNRLLMENSLRLALKRDEFFLHYQPQLDLSTGRIIGMEALLRWRHPELGAISPAVFIPVMEEIGLIVPLTEWVMHTACAQNKEYQRKGCPPVRVAVNLSSHDLNKNRLVDSVGRVLKDTHLDPEFLELEMTEGALVRDVSLTTAILRKLDRMGVTVAIDDFGTGYSSLSYLRHFPIGRLKIDRSFIEFVATDRNNAAISRAIIALAHSLKINVMAEGVETVHQLEFLRAQQCDEGQGFLFSQPLSPAAAEEFLAAENASPSTSQ